MSAELFDISNPKGDSPVCENSAEENAELYRNVEEFHSLQCIFKASAPFGLFLLEDTLHYAYLFSQ